MGDRELFGTLLIARGPWARFESAPTEEMARARPGKWPARLVGALGKRAYNSIFVSVGAVFNRADPNKPRKEMAL